MLNLKKWRRWQKSTYLSETPMFYQSDFRSWLLNSKKPTELWLPKTNRQNNLCPIRLVCRQNK